MPKRLTSDVLLGEVVLHEVAADPEVTADRLPNAVAVEGACQRVGNGVGDRAVVLVAGVQRRHEVVATLEDRTGQQLDPLGDDRPQVRVDDDEGLGLEGGRDLEDGPQSGALAADPVDLGIGQADSLETVGRPDEEDLLDVIRRLGLHDDPLRAVRRSSVRIDEHRAQVGEVLDEAGLRRADHVADGRCVLEARYADHDVGATEAGDLVADGRRERGRGHLGDPTTSRAHLPRGQIGLLDGSASRGWSTPFDRWSGTSAREFARSTRRRWSGQAGSGCSTP